MTEQDITRTIHAMTLGKGRVFTCYETTRPGALGADFDLSPDFGVRVKGSVVTPFTNDEICADYEPGDEEWVADDYDNDLFKAKFLTAMRAWMDAGMPDPKLDGDDLFKFDL